MAVRSKLVTGDITLIDPNRTGAVTPGQSIPEDGRADGVRPPEDPCNRRGQAALAPDAELSQ